MKIEFARYLKRRFCGFQCYIDGRKRKAVYECRVILRGGSACTIYELIDVSADGKEILSLIPDYTWQKPEVDCQVTD
ncbi:MAG: hypothetical protein AB1489_23505 [Acidobacteriota bacterium]